MIFNLIILYDLEMSDCQNHGQGGNDFGCVGARQLYLDIDDPRLRIY